MRSPTECQGKTFHLPDMANPNKCKRCMMPITEQMPSAITYEPDTNPEHIRI